MYIKNYENETADSILNRVKRNVRRGIDVLSKSSLETVHLAEHYMPEAVKAFLDYINQEISSQDASLKNNNNVSVLRQRLVSAFETTSLEAMYALTHSTFTYQHESYIYNLLESQYDVSLIVDSGMETIFRQDYKLQRSIQKFGWRQYVAQYQGYILFIDSDRGRVLRYSKVFDSDVELKVNEVDGTLTINEGKNSYVAAKRWMVLNSCWVNMTHSDVGLVKSKGKVYRRIQLSKASKDEFKKAYYISVHQLVCMCEVGYNLLKHCRHGASLLTVDHRDSDTLNNSIDNLAIVTRVDNVKKMKYNFVAYDFIEFYERVERDRANVKERSARLHYELQKQNYLEQ